MPLASSTSQVRLEEGVRTAAAERPLPGYCVAQLGDRITDEVLRAVGT